LIERRSHRVTEPTIHTQITTRSPRARDTIAAVSTTNFIVRDRSLPQIAASLSMRFLALVAFLLGCPKTSKDEPPSPTPVATPAPKPSGCEKPGSTVCVDDEVVECLDSGKLGVTLQRCNGGCSAGACRETCAVRDAELVYVVDAANNLASFDPRKLPGDPFHPIGRLTCETKTTPFSMAVDRNGIGWVLYNSGNLYRVSIIDAKCSQATTADGAPGLFGMGFVTDGKDAKTEKLFVAAYEGDELARLDVAQKRPPWQRVGALGKHKQNPELSGTGGGQLFGFFPEDGDGFVQEIDRETGALLGKPMKVGSPKGEVGGWAFAHWGGTFYVFVTIAGYSNVYAVDGKTGKSKVVREQLPERIVGAGVSTCAPLLEQPPQ
jgi:hypothetical protein